VEMRRVMSLDAEFAAARARRSGVARSRFRRFREISFPLIVG